MGPFELPLPSPEGPIRTPEHALSRPWHDYGKDTGPRLRVKGLRDEPGPPAPTADDEQDPGDWRERNRKYREARASGDDAALSKLMPQVLDELHSGEQKPAVVAFSWDELEPFFVAELREWGKARALTGGRVGFQRLLDGSSVIRVPIPNSGGDSHEIRIDRRSAVMAWREAEGNARRAAAILGVRVAEAYRDARATEVICVPELPA